jgi:hypothetical protein
MDNEPAHSHSSPGCVFIFSGCHLSSDIQPELAVESNKLDSIVMARNPQSSKDIAKSIRSPIDTKSPSLTNADMELAVQVHVEQSVSVEYDSQDRESDHHRKPTNAWGF